MLFPQYTVISAFNLYPRNSVLLHLIPQDTEFLVHIQPKHSGFRRGEDCFPFFRFHFQLNSIDMLAQAFNQSFFSVSDFFTIFGA